MTGSGRCRLLDRFLLGKTFHLDYRRVSEEGMVMLGMKALDGATVECAGALVACE